MIHDKDTHYMILLYSFLEMVWILVWVWILSRSFGMDCMAMFAAFPSTIMDSTTVGRAPKAPAPLLWRRPKAASIIVDGKIANIAIQPIPKEYRTTYPYTQTQLVF